ncbi:MAG: peptide deformylase [Alphaproteobacteria bacterium]|nr:peptide deformylase [Alphaproteobacteria bacterium]
MAIKPIVFIPDPVLRQVATPVEDVNAGIRSLMDDMLDTMYDAPGIGLAAPQIGISKRVIVMDCSDDDEADAPLKMANPEIITLSDASQTMEEGCLSIPGHHGEVTRPNGVTVRYLDENNEPRELTCEGLLAVCIQHEIDHLNGVLFIDYLSRLKRDMIVRKMTKDARGQKG